MTYSIQRITTIDSTVLRRLFDDCESKATDNFSDLNGKSSDEKFELLLGAAEIWATKGMCLECSKDGTVVFVAWGMVENMNWKLSNFLAGRDASGSRSFLYDTDWLVAMRDFHLTMTSVYTSHENVNTPNKSAKTFLDNRLTVADADSQFTHNATEDTVVDTDYVSRTISGIE